MGSQNCGLKSPKEEQQVPESVEIESSTMKNIDILDELESILGIEDGDSLLGGDDLIELNFSEWDEFSIGEEQIYKNEEEEYDEVDQQVYEMKNSISASSEFYEQNNSYICGKNVIKRENSSKNLNLNLNYQEVMDAWSNRGFIQAAEEYSHSMTNNTFMGEVPVMEEEKTRREKVLRYKEKRQSRLFSKRIRYQVRKLNAEKRPRLKGRFVKQ